MPKSSSEFHLKSHISSFITGQEQKYRLFLSAQPTYFSLNAKITPDVLRASLNNDIIMQ